MSRPINLVVFFLYDFELYHLDLDLCRAFCSLTIIFSGVQFRRIRDSNRVRKFLGSSRISDYNNSTTYSRGYEIELRACVGG